MTSSTDSVFTYPAVSFWASPPNVRSKPPRSSIWTVRPVEVGVRPNVVLVLFLLLGLVLAAILTQGEGRRAKRADERENGRKAPANISNHHRML